MHNSLVHIRIEPLVVAPLVSLGKLQQVTQSATHQVLYRGGGGDRGICTLQLK